MLADIELAREKFKQEMALEWEKLRMQMELERAKVNSQAGLEREKMFREQTQELDAPDAAEGALPKPKPGIADQLTETLREASKQSQEAMEAMAEAVKALADAQTAPKTITDGKGRSFTVKRGD
jgi:hypothetical protein